MTRFWWVRHGPTHKKTMVGWTDVPADLSDHHQVERLKSYLPSKALIVSSDLTRCIQTADIITNDQTILPARQELREIHFGDWENQSYQTAQDSHPELIQQYWENPGDIAAPNGESWNQLTGRVDKCISELCNNHPDQDIIVVAHFGVILSQIQKASGMDNKSVLSFQIDNLSVTRLDFLNPQWRVTGVNHKP